MTNNISSKMQFIETLRSLIREGDEVDRSYAIRGLANLNDQDSNELLFHCLHDEDLDVSIDTVNALGDIGGEQVVEKLIESLINDPEGEIKVACLVSLTKLKATQAIPHFLAIAENPPEEMNFTTGDWDLWWDMQLQSIKALGALRVTEGIPVLQRLVQSNDYLDIENEIFKAIVAIGGEDSDRYLLSLLTHASPRIKRRVARVLGTSQSASTLKLLARALKDNDADVREATLLALQERRVVQYLPAILVLFRDNNAMVRKTAVKVARALSQQANKNGSHKTFTLIAKLTPLLHDTDPMVKTSVLETLMGIGWKARKEEVEQLTSQLENSKGDYFASICRVITQQNLEDGYARLLYLLRHNMLDSEAKLHALAALGKSGKWSSVIESTIGALIFDDDAVVRLEALQALANLDQSYPQHSAYKGRLPITMVAEALEGKLAPPANKKIIPIVPIEEIENKFDQTETKEPTDTAREKRDTAFVDHALEQISQSIADGEKPHPLSTLDAIAITHVEDEIERTAATENKESVHFEEAESKEDLSDFITLTENNKKISKWLFNKESVDVSIDIKRLAARILGTINTNNAPVLLLHTFSSDDQELKREAALSIAQLFANKLTNKKAVLSIQNSVVIPLRESLKKELNADNRDLRIATARALAEIGITDDIPTLIACLSDEDIAMRKQVLNALSKIATRANNTRINYVALAELIVDQLKSKELGIHRAAIEAVIPLFTDKLNGSLESLKQTAISHLIQAGLSGSHGQVKEMSWGMKILDKELSSTLLLEKINNTSNSVERRYMVEMLGNVHNT